MHAYPSGATDCAPYQELDEPVRRLMKLKNELLGALLTLLVLLVFSWPFLANSPETSLFALADRALYSLAGGRFHTPPSARTYPVSSSIREENASLHQLLSLRSRLSGQVVAARVTRRDPDSWWSFLTVEFDSPEANPPKETAMVLTPQGVIGSLDNADIVLVQSGDERFFRGRVRLLSSPETQLSVVVGDRQSPFLLEGRGGPALSLRPVTSGAEDQIVESDGVRTSGLGHLYSKGLQVGTVDKDRQFATFTALPSTPAEVLIWWR